MTIVPVILCGGSGTRLWPLSRKSFPKQFVPLIDGKSLLQLTLERVSSLGPEVMCVASDEHRFFVAEAMQAAHVQGRVLLEPVPRNTAAAMAIAALTAKPQDPMREEGYGVCESCRRMVATDMSQYGYAGKVYTMNEAITHLTRYA